jgi:SAM-dependent methyltransferase
MSAVLPPGTLLQLMYLDERLKRMPPGRFIEIGPGSGEITARLAKLGWRGTVYDLSEDTISGLAKRFANEIREGRIEAKVGDFLQSAAPERPESRADLVISCMVMEHLDDAGECAFMRQAARQLRPHGLVIGFVPASPAHWGIEDDIAGHCRRYSRQSLKTLLETTGWVPRHLAGLTYPISNILLPLSDLLVRRSEAQKLALPVIERTRLSGRRNVRFKTHFPALLKLVLNDTAMLPLHWMQKAFTRSERALVLYFEAARRNA